MPRGKRKTVKRYSKKRKLHFKHPAHYIKDFAKRTENSSNPTTIITTPTDSDAYERGIKDGRADESRKINSLLKDEMKKASDRAKIATLRDVGIMLAHLEDE